MLLLQWCKSNNHFRSVFNIVFFKYFSPIFSKPSTFKFKIQNLIPILCYNRGDRYLKGAKWQKFYLDLNEYITGNLNLKYQNHVDQKPSVSTVLITVSHSVVYPCYTRANDFFRFLLFSFRFKGPDHLAPGLGHSGKFLGST